MAVQGPHLKQNYNQSYLNSYSNSPQYKTQICKNFQDSGHCDFGSHCQFAHGKVTQVVIWRCYYILLIIQVHWSWEHCLTIWSTSRRSRWSILVPLKLQSRWHVSHHVSRSCARAGYRQECARYVDSVELPTVSMNCPLQVQSPNLIRSNLAETSKTRVTVPTETIVSSHTVYRLDRSLR